MAVAFTRTATLSSSTNASNIVTATMDIGTIAGDRVLAIAVAGEPASAAVINSCTVGGISATAASSVSQLGNTIARIFYVPFPTATSTSTTATVAVTFSGLAAATENEIAVYKLTGASTTLQTRRVAIRPPTWTPRRR